MNEGKDIHEGLSSFLKSRGYRSNEMPDEYENWKDPRTGKWIPMSKAVLLERARCHQTRSTR